MLNVRTVLSIELEENIDFTFSSSLGSTLLFIKKVVIDHLYLWVIRGHQGGVEPSSPAKASVATEAK